MALEPMEGFRLHLKLIWGTPSYFSFLGRHQCPSRLVTVFLGTLWISMKQIKAPYVFDVDHGIPLHPMLGNRASSHNKRDVSWFFPNCGRNLGYILELQRGLPFKILGCSLMSGLMSSYEGHLRSLLEAWQGNTNASGGEEGDPVSLFGCHSDIGIPSNFQQESGISIF